MQNSNNFLGTIPRTPVSGERKVCFHSPKMYQNSPTVIAMHNSKIFRGTKPRTFVLGGSLFSFSENVLKLSYGKAEFKNFPGDNTPDPHFREEESLFSFSENVPKLFYSNAEFKNFPWDNTPNPRFRGEESLFSFSENVPELSYSNAEFLKKSGGRTPGPRFLGMRGERCLLLKLCLATPLISNLTAIATSFLG